MIAIELDLVLEDEFENNCCLAGTDDFDALDEFAGVISALREGDTTGDLKSSCGAIERSSEASKDMSPCGCLQLGPMVDEEVSKSGSVGLRICFPEIFASNFESVALERATLLINGLPRSAPADLGLPLGWTDGNGFHSPLNAHETPSCRAMLAQWYKSNVALLVNKYLQCS